jgi:hypothetical protein
MAHGGARPGAGRKPGGTNQATRDKKAFAHKVAAEGITPLEVMIEHMRTCYNAGNMAAAHDAAKDVAPYVHPRLGAINANVDQHTTLSIDDDPIDELLAEVDRRRQAMRNGEDNDPTRH